MKNLPEPLNKSELNAEYPVRPVSEKKDVKRCSHFIPSATYTLKELKALTDESDWMTVVRGIVYKTTKEYTEKWGYNLMEFEKLDILFMNGKQDETLVQFRVQLKTERLKEKGSYEQRII